jgi:glucose/arabinose dehydrogenase
MRGTALLGVLLGLAAVAGCSQGGDEKVDTITPSAALSQPDATASTPAGAGPTVVTTMATGLAVPWGLGFLPDGAAVVTERDSGRVLLVAGPQQVTEVGHVGDAAPEGEGGLLGVAVSPGFDQDHTLYFYVSTQDDNRIVTATLDGTVLSETAPIFTGIPIGPIHDGGRLAFGPDGMLYASTGETGDSALAQDKQSLGGKILRLTPDGQPAPGNPFGTAVWSFGHRNVQGLAWVDGQLWASEFGQDSYDELNEIVTGHDYGWPLVEGAGGTSQGFTDPVRVSSTDEASPSGLAYDQGSLWMGALRGERLWQIPVHDQTTSDPIAWFVGDYGRMRTVVTAPDGNLWVTTSNRDGRGDPNPGDDRILVIKP